MDHDQVMHNHDDMPEPKLRDYLLFAGIILFIFLGALGYEYFRGFGWTDFMRVFMGVFFLVFAIFKLLDLRGFMVSYIGYDVIAKRWMAWGYIYPFVELALAFSYFFGVAFINIATFVLMAVGSVGIIQQLSKGSKIKCACLGTYINLPLTTVSLVEDLAMGVMALVLIVFK